MSEKVQICVDIDDMGFAFIPVTKERSKKDEETFGALPRVMTMWVDADLVKEWNDASDRFAEVNTKLEQLYRIQQGIEPFLTPDVPNYEKIEG